MPTEAIALFDYLNPPMLLPAEVFSTQDLPKRERRLYRHVAAFYASYLQRYPDFETTNLRDISGRICPVVKLPTLDKMITYCIRSGFLRDALPPVNTA